MLLSLSFSCLLFAGALDLAPAPLAQTENDAEDSGSTRLWKWLALFFVTLVFITGGGLAVYKLRKYLHDEDIL